MPAIDRGDRAGATVVESTRDLALLIRARRRELGLSQEELAGVVGLDRSVLTMLEGGRRRLTFDVALRLVQALGMDVLIRPRPR